MNTYFFHVDENFVVIVSKKYWKENHCLDDQHISEDLEELGLLHPGLSEITESTFEASYSNFSVFRTEMLNMGYQENQEFSEWCNNHEFC